jgi:hypothetical protein
MPYHQNIVRRVMLLPVLLPLWVVLSTSQSMCSHEFFVKRNRIPVLLHVLATVHIYIVWFKFEKVLKSSNFNFRVSYWARISGQAHGEPLARPSAGTLPGTAAVLAVKKSTAVPVQSLVDCNRLTKFLFGEVLQGTTSASRRKHMVTCRCCWKQHQA